MKLKTLLYAAVAALLASPVTAHAVDFTQTACNANPNAIGCGPTGVAIFGSNGIVTVIISTLIYAVGAVSIVMIVIGGLRYALSGGDSAGIKSAKDTILYALVGLVVSILAYTIVQFIIGKVG